MKVVTKIRSRPSRSPATGRATPEEVSEHITEYVIESAEPESLGSTPSRTRSLKGAMTELVITATFIRVGENPISFGYLLELLLRLLIARVTVGVAVEPRTEMW